MIRAGLVSVNGVVCSNLATRVEEGDVVKIGNRVLHTAPLTTLLLHKPPGFLCTASDTEGRRTIFDLLPPNFTRLFHVGRLDRESEGLMLVTNDGDLALKLTHPRYKVEKEYEVVLDQAFDFTLTPQLLKGVHTPEGFARAESIHRIARNKLKVVLRQGLKRQIRHMFYEVGYEVIKLVRTRIGPIVLEGVPPAAWRVLTQAELKSLLAAGKAPGDKGESRQTLDAAAKSAPPSRAGSRGGDRKAPGAGRTDFKSRTRRVGTGGGPARPAERRSERPDGERRGGGGGRTRFPDKRRASAPSDRRPSSGKKPSR